MTYNDFLNVAHFYSIKPWLYDFYMVGFKDSMNLQDFCNYAHENVKGGVEGWQIHVENNNAYFAVPKANNQTIPEELFSSLNKVEDVPEEEPQ